jgi:hypothetical protein
VSACLHEFTGNVYRLIKAYLWEYSTEVHVVRTLVLHMLYSLQVESGHGWFSTMPHAVWHGTHFQAHKWTVANIIVSCMSGTDV